MYGEIEVIENKLNEVSQLASENCSMIGDLWNEQEGFRHRTIDLDESITQIHEKLEELQQVNFSDIAAFILAQGQRIAELARKVQDLEKSTKGESDKQGK